MTKATNVYLCCSSSDSKNWERRKYESLIFVMQQWHMAALGIFFFFLTHGAIKKFVQQTRIQPSYFYVLSWCHHHYLCHATSTPHPLHRYGVTTQQSK